MFARALAVLLAFSSGFVSFAKGAMTPKKFDLAAYEKRYKAAYPAGGDHELVYDDVQGNSVSVVRMSDGFVVKETPKNGLVVIYREYFPDGTVKTDGKIGKVSGEPPLGRWTAYTASGAVEKVEDFDAGYRIGLEDVLKICRERGIDPHGRLSSVFRVPPGKEPLWVVQWNSGKPGKGIHKSAVISGPTTLIQSIEIDGKTGKVVDGKSHEHLDN